jgi:hypothetical protein
VTFGDAKMFREYILDRASISIRPTHIVFSSPAGLFISSRIQHLKTRIPSLIDLQDQINEGSAAPNRTPAYCQSLKLTRPPALTHSICFFCYHSPNAPAFQLASVVASFSSIDL